MSLSHWKILIVEDTDDDITMVSKILTYHGAEVYVARSGDQCLKMLPGLDADLVVMDLGLPIMDGWQTLAAMRSNARFAHIPVVAATAYYSAETAHDTREAGFDAYFEKPLNPRLFVQDIVRLIDN